MFGATGIGGTPNAHSLGAENLGSGRKDEMSAFALLGAATIVSQSETVALVLGIAWLGSCLGRLLSIVVDRSWSVHAAVSGVADLVMFALLVPLA